jgi:hypothetical protein
MSRKPYRPRPTGGHVLFTDISEAELYAVNVHDRTDVKFLFKTDDLFVPVHYAQGPDGQVYYADLIAGVIGRLEVTPAALIGTEAAETLDGGSGAEVIEARGGNDVAIGAGGDDRLFGERGNDLLRGGVGDDLLVGGAGDDTLEGGAGLDTAGFGRPRNEYTVDAGAGGTITVAHQRPGQDGTDTLKGVEALAFPNPAVFRFFDMRQGSHFYTASAAGGPVGPLRL